MSDGVNKIDVLNKLKSRQFDEFKEAFKEFDKDQQCIFLEQADKNKDGNVSRVELKEAIFRFDTIEPTFNAEFAAKVGNKKTAEKIKANQKAETEKMLNSWTQQGTEQSKKSMEEANAKLEASPAPAPIKQETKEAEPYTVKKGDNLYKIVKKHTEGLSKKEIMEKVKLLEKDNQEKHLIKNDKARIFAGQKLDLSALETESKPEKEKPAANAPEKKETHVTKPKAHTAKTTEAHKPKPKTSEAKTETQAPKPKTTLAPAPKAQEPKPEISTYKTPESMPKVTTIDVSKAMNLDKTKKTNINFDKLKVKDSNTKKETLEFIKKYNFGQPADNTQVANNKVDYRKIGHKVQATKKYPTKEEIIKFTSTDSKYLKLKKERDVIKRSMDENQRIPSYDNSWDLKHIQAKEAEMEQIIQEKLYGEQ